MFWPRQIWYLILGGHPWRLVQVLPCFTHNCNMSKMNFTFQDWICSLRADKGHMQSHTACSWGCKIWRSVAETQRPLPAPEVSNTPQGYSFLMFFEIWCAWWSFVVLQLNNARYGSCFYMLCLALRLGGGCDISGQLSRGPFQIMLHCASLQWMTLLLPCSPGQRTGWVPQVREPLKRCPKRWSERMEEKRVTWDELILIIHW